MLMQQHVYVASPSFRVLSNMLELGMQQELFRKKKNGSVEHELICQDSLS